MEKLTNSEVMIWIFKNVPISLRSDFDFRKSKERNSNTTNTIEFLTNTLRLCKEDAQESAHYYKERMLKHENRNPWIT